MLFESERTFRLWRAVVGHGQLLLRSNKRAGDESRIDVLFKPVTAMKLIATMEGLVIREAVGNEAQEIRRELGNVPITGSKPFIVESAGFKGYVYASSMTFLEDDGAYSDPSGLLVEPSDLADA